MKRLSVVLSILIFIAGCSKNSSHPNYPYYFSGVISGKSIVYNASDVNTQYGCGISFPANSAGQDVDQYVGTMIQDPSDPTTSSIEVYQLKRFDHTPTNQEMSAMWSVGTFNFGKSNISSTGGQTVNGASIRYYDENGDEWDTEGGQQTGSSFVVTELTDNPNHTSAKIFTARFNCILYNDLGHSMKLENGVIRGKLFVP
jgi:hypothetical protein